MFFLIYLITIFIFILLIIDLIRIITPESKLDIKPIKYKINISEIEFIFKILNYSNKKESMVPNLDFNLDYVDNNELVNIEHNKEIIIDDETSLKNFNPSCSFITFPKIVPKYLTSSLKLFVEILS